MSLRDEWIHRLAAVPAEVRTSVAIDQLVRIAEERAVLLVACQDFVAKCDRGEAKSKRSYAQMVAAINKATGAAP